MPNPLKQLPLAIAATALAVTLGVVLNIQLRPPASDGPPAFLRTHLKSSKETTVAPAPLARREPPPENPGRSRWAVVPSFAMSKSSLSDLLTAALAKKSDLQLVERGQIDALLREQSVSDLLGTDAAGGRLKLGRLLRADVLVLLGRQGKGGKQFVRIVISDTAYGARLGLEFLPYDAAKLNALIEPIIAFVDQTRSRYPDGVQAIVAVPPFVCRNLVHRYDHLERQLSHVLQAGLAAHPGTAVLEIEQARAIQREEVLTGHSDEARVIPVFIEGEYRVTEAGEAKGAVQLTLRITSGGRQRSIEEDLPGTPDVVRYLQTQVPPQVLHIPESEAKATLSADRQVALLGRRADAFYRLGELVESSALREAALLIDPNNAAQARRLFHEYMLMVPFEKHISYYTYTTEEVIQTWKNRAWAWRRGLRILEYLIRNNLILQEEALPLADEMGRSMRDFKSNNPYDGASFAPEPSAMDVLRDEYAQCTRTHRRFVRTVMPRVLGLRSKRKKDVFEAMRKACFLCGWLHLSMRLPQYSTDVRVPNQIEDLNQMARVLCEYCPDDLFLSEEILLFLTAKPILPNGRPRHRDAAYLQFLQRLATASQWMTRAYGRLGLILYDHRHGRDGKKTTGEEMLRRLDAWETEVNREFRRRRAFRGVLKRLPQYLEPIRKAATLTTALPTSTQRPPQRIERPAIDLGKRLAFTEVALRVVRKFGKTIDWRASEPSHAADWLEWGGAPHHLIRGKTFDLFYNETSILIHRKPARLEALFRLRGNHQIKDVAFDGTNVWALTCCQGVFVVSTSGEQIAHAGEDAGLPYAHHAGWLLAREPGRIVAVGSFGPQKRAWCANLALRNRQVTVDIFHEATAAFPDTDQALVDQRRDPQAAFVPAGLYFVPDPHEETGGSIIVPRGLYGYALRLLPEQRKVEVVDSPIDGPRFKHERRAYHFMANGNRLDAYHQTLRVWIPPSHLKSGEKSLRTLYDFGDKNYSFYGAIFAYQGYLYAPGREWVRVNAESLQVERLGPGKLGDPLQRNSFHDGFFGVSAHFGLVAWDERGHFYKVTVKSADAGAEDVMIRRAVAKFDEQIAAHPTEEHPHRAKTSYLFTARRLKAAKAACLAWIEAYPHTMEARFALIDIERKIRSGLGRFDSNPEWSKGPHETFAAWRLFNDPGRGSEPATALPGAIRLPFAADQTEWYIAEIAAYDAVAGPGDFDGPLNRKRVIDYCNLWEKAGQGRRGRREASYLCMRAYARLRSGAFELAEADAKAAVQRQETNGLWAGDAKPLLRAAQARDKDFEWKYEQSRFHAESWLLESP